MTDTTTTSDLLESALAGLPAKLRVHELAKRAGISSKQAIAALADLGVTVTAASSSVDSAAATAVLTALLGPGPEAAEAPAEPEPEVAANPGPPAADAPADGLAGLFLAPAAAPTKLASRRRRPAKAVPVDDASSEAQPVALDHSGSSPDLSASGDPIATEPSLDITAIGDEAVVETSETDQADSAPAGRRRRGRSGGRGRSAPATDQPENQVTEALVALPDLEPDPLVADDELDDPQSATGEDADEAAGRRRRRRGRRGRGRPDSDEEFGPVAGSEEPSTAASAQVGAEVGAEENADEDSEPEASGDGTSESANRRRRRRRRRSSGDDQAHEDDPDNTVVHVRETREVRAVRPAAPTEVQGVRGSTRLEAKRQRRRDTRDTRRRPQILTEAEFLARRESVDRVMAVRQRGDLAQVALLEDGVLVEHFVSRAGTQSLMGNIYLGRVQNVLPSMEAAFVDIGKGRNAVIYAGEVNWDAAGLAGKARRIETALNSGDTLLVQVSKDPVGQKGARLTTQISLPGRFVVFVPAGGATGISRKLPDIERKRLKSIMDRIVPEDAGVIIRTAAEGIAEDELARDVERLKEQWDQISAAAQKKSVAPLQLSSEPDTLIKVVRDLFNSDISRLILDGEEAYRSVADYVSAVAPELADRVSQFDSRPGSSADVFTQFRIDEQIAKALERKVHLPSGGSLVIDRTEAMTVVDVNTGKYTGSGGNLEETVTKNNLEAAEEIVRQLRLRDVGGIIVVDFIDMVLESNRELVLRRLTECLGRDRTRHQVAEVTSLGLVQMTRKKMGTGLVEAFSEPCSHCGGRGIVLHDVPVEPSGADSGDDADRRSSRGRRGRSAREGGGDAGSALAELPRVVLPVVRPPDPRGPKPRFTGSVDPVGPISESAAALSTSADLAADLAAAADLAVADLASADLAVVDQASADLAVVDQASADQAVAVDGRPATPSATDRDETLAGVASGLLDEHGPGPADEPATNGKAIARQSETPAEEQSPSRGRSRGRRGQPPREADQPSPASHNAPLSAEASAAVSAVLAALEARSSPDLILDRPASPQTNGTIPGEEPDSTAPAGRRRGRRAAGRPAGAPAGPESGALMVLPAVGEPPAPAAEPSAPAAQPSAPAAQLVSADVDPATEPATPTGRPRRRRAATRPAGPAGVSSVGAEPAGQSG